MKRTNRTIALLMAILMIVMAFAACGESGDKNDLVNNAGDINELSGSTMSETGDLPTAAPVNESKNLANSFDGRDDVSYVMIYNPNIYDELSENNATLSTGKLSQWIDTDVNRAEGLDEEPEFTSFSQKDAMDKFQGSEAEADLDGDRAAGLQPVYKKDAKHSFYYYDDLSDTTTSKSSEYVCSYVGNHCYVWTLKSENISASEAEKIAKEFDSKIYDNDVKLFGTPRFADEGGKIHLLFHNIKGNTLGYFNAYDLFTSSEITKAQADLYQLNLDHAIVHINSRFFGKGLDDMIYSTMAHEFQHLINFTDYFYTKNYVFPSTWINEAMSGYAEESLYKGAKIIEGHYESLAESDLIRSGQSLYNFKTNNYDIGVYGSVYLFSEYLAKNNGSDVYTKLHKYWRESGSKTLDTAEAIHKSVSSSYSKSIDSVISYPSSIKFATKSQEWMSKMTLDYYISLMKFDTSDPDCYKNIKSTDLLYDEVNAAKIEGGGRIVFATKDGKFSIPSDADKNLVYVGFDKDMNQITKPICK